MSEKCSKCGKENITFNKDWVCVDCMSEQLLGGLDEPLNYGPNVIRQWDPVNRPAHYNQFPVEVIDIIEWYFPNNYHLGNATKYLLRSAYKGHEIEDLRKLVWYVERYIESKEGHANTVPDLPSEQGDS